MSICVQQLLTLSEQTNLRCDIFSKILWIIMNLCYYRWIVNRTRSHFLDYTDSTPLQETQNNMCSSGSSHAILHMATFKGFFFFHAGFNLICCPGIEEAEHIMELYSVSYRERDGLKNCVCVHLYIHIYTVYKNKNALYGRSDVIPYYCVTISKLRQIETIIKLIFSKLLRQTKRGIGVILYNHFWKMLV